MEASRLLVVMATTAAAIGAFMLSQSVQAYLAQRKLQEDMYRRAGAGGFARGLVRNGITPLMKPARVFLGVRWLRTSVERMVTVLRLHGVECDVLSLTSVLLGACVVLFVVGFALGSWVAGVAFAICVFAAGSAWSSHMFERRRDSIREALPDAVRAMSACFHAGYTLQQTFGQLQRELKGPIGGLFGSARDAMDTGSTAREALAALRGSSIVPELSFISVALEVQHRAGGSMRHVLDSACESLESELELRRSLRVHTAQARLSARVVTGVTIGLVGVLSLLTDDFLGPFFASGLGMAMLTAAVAMQCAGVLIIRKMLRVEVD